MAKIYERLLSTNILREKMRDLFHPQRENLLSEDNICMAKLMKVPRVIVFVFLLHDCLASVFSEEKCCFVKLARKLKRYHYRYTVRSILVKR